MSVNSELYIIAKAVSSDLEADLGVDDSVGQARGNHVVALGAYFHRAKLWQSGVLCICCIHCCKNCEQYFQKLHFDRLTNLMVSISLSKDPMSRLYSHRWRTREEMLSSSALTVKVSLLDRSKSKSIFINLGSLNS